jgi:hypothetical protein
MFKFILGAVVAVAIGVGLIACGEVTSESIKVLVQAQIKNVPGLEDCTYSKVDLGPSVANIHVIRCPASTVSTYSKQGKSAPVETVTVDTKISTPSPIMDPTSPMNAVSALVDQAEARAKAAEKEKKIEALRAAIEQLKAEK